MSGHLGLVAEAMSRSGKKLIFPVGKIPLAVKKFVRVG